MGAGRVFGGWGRRSRRGVLSRKIQVCRVIVLWIHKCLAVALSIERPRPPARRFSLEKPADAHQAAATSFWRSSCTARVGLDSVPTGHAAVNDWRLIDSERGRRRFASHLSEVMTWVY